MRETTGAPRFPLSTWIAIVWLFACLCLPFAASAAHDDPQLQLLSQIDLATDSRRNSDITGYYDPNTGKEYAIMGEWGGSWVYIIDVTDPQNPFEAKVITQTSSLDLKVWDHYLYCVDGDGSLIDDGTIWNIEDPLAPIKVRSLPSAHNIAVADGYLYLSVGYWGVEIFDLADPARPAMLWNDNTHSGHDVTIVGNRMYDFHGGSGTFIYDITNKSAPSMIGGIPNAADMGIAYHHNGAPSTNGNYLYITDELGNSTAPDITVWNITDPSAPYRVRTWTDQNATVHNVYVVDDLLFASFYVAGVRVFDITEPWNPVLLDEYDTSPGYTGNGAFNGCWGLYLDAPSGVIYASDIENGLFLFSFPVAVPVTITAFNAEYSNGAVDVTWQISYSDGLQGFRVYRSHEPDDSYRPVASLSASAPHAFTDTDVEYGRTYYYRLGATDRDGEFLSQTREVTIPTPEFTLRQNYPNPFNPTTTIEFVLSETKHVTLEIYDAAGRRVRKLLDETRAAGPHAVTWNGTDDAGMQVSSGVYFCRLDGAGVTETRRMTLVK
jgi:choice-of-anchor B domain-containing protein